MKYGEGSDSLMMLNRRLTVKLCTFLKIVFMDCKKYTLYMQEIIRPFDFDPYS